MIWLLSIIIAIAAAGLGFSLGRARRSATSVGVSGVSVPSVPPKSSQKQESLDPVQVNMAEHMLSIFEEINYMQASDDLFDRYQSFTALSENALTHAMGSCSVTLWSPDHENKNLIECVIRPVQSSRKPLNGRVDNATQKRRPCSVPLDSGAIRRSLESGKPFLADLVKGSMSRSGVDAVSLFCDACIPLFRKYGQPLLVNIQWSQAVKADTTWSRSQREAAFNKAVRLIKLFWAQLQATNQREWMVEHDEPTGALRDDVFLQQGQVWAGKCRAQDEPFAVVVLTVRGFRTMFAGNSQQWKSLSGLIVRALQKILTEKQRDFLLGKMADDAFALLLPYMDEFLAGKIMDSVMGQLGEEISEAESIEMLDIMAVDVQWTVGDGKLYKGDLTGMLDKIYRRLFSRGPNKQNKNYRVILNRQKEEEVEHAGR